MLIKRKTCKVCLRRVWIRRFYFKKKGSLYKKYFGSNVLKSFGGKMKESQGKRRKRRREEPGRGKKGVGRVLRGRGEGGREG